MSDSRKPNSWSKAAASSAELDVPTERDRTPQVEWSLAPLSVLESADLFEPALANPLVRVLTAFAKRKTFALFCGLLLLGGSAYCLANPSIGMVVGWPVEYCSIALAAAAVLLALLVTLGAWLRPLESVEDAIEVLSVPLMAFEKGGESDVR